MDTSPPESRRRAVGRTRRLLRWAGAVASVLALGLVLGGGAAADAGDDPTELPLLGRGFTIGGDRVTFHDMVLPAGIKQVATGGQHSVALLTDGSLYAWGFNSSGQLGTGGTDKSLVPVPVRMDGALDGVEIVYVAAGYAFTLALDSDGRAYGWGLNAQGQLGNGSLNNTSVPVQLESYAVGEGEIALDGVKLTSIAGGSNHGVALSDEGNAYAWGDGSPLTGGSSGARKGVVAKVDTSGIPAGVGLTQVSADQNHTVALGSNGLAYAWGKNEKGQFGDGNTKNSYDKPAQIGALVGGVAMTYVGVAAGTFHSALLGTDGRIYTAGDNSYGQMANGSETGMVLEFLPVDNAGALDGVTVTRISAGNYSSLAESADGQVYSWGGYQRIEENRWGKVTRPTAQLTDPAFDGVVITDAQPGLYHVVALGAGGRAYVWGAQNGNGQLGIGSTSSGGVVPTRLPTHKVFFGPDRLLGVDVKPDFHEGTIEVTTPAHKPGDVEVYLERLW